MPFRTSDKFFFGGIRILIYYGLQLVNQKGEVSLLARNVASTIVEGGTADAFGRTMWDENILYVVTNGGIAGPVPRTKTTGGKVIAVDMLGSFVVDLVA